MIASIIITNFNYEKYVGRCIRSCLNQSIQEPYEVILVDDKSSDDSIKIAREFKNFNNFHVLQNNKNKGVAYSANRGFKYAKGKYIVRVDADDYVSKNFLFFLVYYMVENKTKLGVSCDYTLIDNNEKKISNVSSFEKPISCGILYNRNQLSKYGFYNQNFRHREEEELRVRINRNYKIGHLALALYRYRMHFSNKTKSVEYLKKYKKIIENTILKQILKSTKKIKNRGKVIAIIPARSGSKRLKNKNIYKFKNYPMIYWTIKAALKSKFIDYVYVTSDSSKILNISKKFGAKVIVRPKKLSLNNVPKLEAIRHAITEIKNKYKKINIVVSLQANSPNITTMEIDKCISVLINKNRDEVLTLDKNFNQSPSIRVMKFKTLFNTFLSTHFSCVVNDVADIHVLKDLKNLELNR